MRKSISGLGAALLLCACSSLKTASLRDARILKPGASEVAAELSASGPIERATLKLAARHYPDLKALCDSLDVQRPAGKTDLPLFGAYFSHGLGHGLEFNVGASTSLTPGGALLVDAGLKKRLYAGGRFALAAYARLAGGMARNFISYGAADSAGGYPSFILGSRSLEGDLAVLTLVRILPRLSCYYNAGLAGGGLSYSFKNELDTTAGREQGYVALLGMTHHIGVALEFKGTEIALEQGFLFYNHGYVPSLGMRVSLKDGWKE